LTASGDIFLERILLWLDDLDDLFGVIGLLSERILRSIAKLMRLVALLSVAGCGIFAALTKPPLGLAVAILLFVFLLYRSATQPGFAVRRRGVAA
jgi:hypothetical protein